MNVRIHMKIRILIGLGLFAVAIAFSFWSYRAGVVASQEMNAIFLMPIVKKQHECLASQDLKCLKVTNDILRSSTEIQVRATIESGLTHGLGKYGKEFIDWSQSTPPEK